MVEEKRPTGRLIAIGDIHGHAKALKKLLEAIVPESSDTVITLGDYVNRGPESKTVIDLLIALQNRCHLVSILGNHDEMMLDSKGDPQAMQRWKAQGGDTTLASYGANGGIDLIPHSHWTFLLNCCPYYETERFVFTHANYCWYSPLDQQPTSLLRWLSLNESTPRPHLSGNKFIVGHTPGLIRDYGFCLCLDTGCGLGGRLTAMDVITQERWQVTESGHQVESEPIIPVR